MGVRVSTIWFVTASYAFAGSWAVSGVVGSDGSLIVLAARYQYVVSVSRGNEPNETDVSFRRKNKCEMNRWLPKSVTRMVGFGNEKWCEFCVEK